jgi:hypothetical protein
MAKLEAQYQVFSRRNGRENGLAAASRREKGLRQRLDYIATLILISFVLLSNRAQDVIPRDGPGKVDFVSLPRSVPAEFHGHQFTDALRNCDRRRRIQE